MGRSRPTTAFTQLGILRKTARGLQNLQLHECAVTRDVLSGNLCCGLAYAVKPHRTLLRWDVEVSFTQHKQNFYLFSALHRGCLPGPR